MSQVQVSTEWYDLFEEYKDLDLEPTDYFSLDKLDNVPRLQFLKGLCWDEVRDWIRHDTTPMSEVLLADDDLDGPGRLFIGGMNDALNDTALRQHQIRAVVSIHPKDLLAWDPNDASYGLRRFGGATTTAAAGDGAGDGDCAAAAAAGVRHHLMIPLSDDAKENMMDYFPDAQDFIGRHLRNGDNILIHCKSGRSRSVAILVAYLQRKHWEETKAKATEEKPSPSPPPSPDEALVMMRAYRDSVIEAVQAARRPIVVIMDRFLPLLDLYDMQLTGHPDFETKRRQLFPDDDDDDDKDDNLKPPNKPPGGGEAAKAVGAVLKLAVAIAFFKHGQKPLRSVVQRFFSVRSEYYPELEGLRGGDDDEEGETYDYTGVGHAKPGIVGYYAHFADEYGIPVPVAASNAHAKAKAKAKAKAIQQ